MVLQVHQFCILSLLDDPSVLEDQDMVTFLHGAQSMSNRYGSLVLQG